MKCSNDLVLIARINEDIKSVVLLARNINLLALNAILLARKAGNVASGFGVISDELRIFSKTLTMNMEALMYLSYESIQTISLHQRHLRMNALMTRATEQLNDSSYIDFLLAAKKQALSLSTNTLQVYERLQILLQDADDTSRFGSVISRSLKIEATYGGDFSQMLSQIAADFSLFIDAIPEVIDRLKNTLRRK
ncbi:hypothetical protein [Cellvibrio sp.]|uniref:hypothetical protein n=1 Tax=Cellvibrio sp. TaxID=1965322 RepID=UPI0039647CAD